MEEALYYLQAKGLVELVQVGNRALGISRSVARITGAGIDCLDGSADMAGILAGGA